MTEKPKKPKRLEFSIKVGPLLIKALEAQRKIIKDFTYDTSNSSYYQAGEIIAKKVLGLI